MSRYRDHKQFYPNHYYHIYNRGNNRTDTFLTPADYEAFLARLKITLGIIPNHIPSCKIIPFKPTDFEILAYCLMSNHFHLLIKQNSTTPVNKLVSKICTSYSMYFNKRHERVGHVWQDRFKAKIITSNEQLVQTVKYILNNPSDPENYPYSSYQELMREENHTLTNIKKFWELFPDQKAFVQFLGAS